MGNFIVPDRAIARPAPLPPPDLRVAREEKIANNIGVESELNRFAAFPQVALRQGLTPAIGATVGGGV